MKAGGTVLDTGKCEREADQLGAIECSYQNAAGGFQGDGQSQRSHICFGQSPDELFELQHTADLGVSFYFTNLNRGLSGRVRHGYLLADQYTRIREVPATHDGHSGPS